MTRKEFWANYFKDLSDEQFEVWDKRIRENEEIRQRMEQYIRKNENLPFFEPQAIVATLYIILGK